MGALDGRGWMVGAYYPWGGWCMYRYDMRRGRNWGGVERLSTNTHDRRMAMDGNV